MASRNLVSLFSAVDLFPSHGSQFSVFLSPFCKNILDKPGLLSSSLSSSKSLWQCHASLGNDFSSQSSRTSAQQGCYRSHILPGVEVDVVCKNDQRSGKLTRGVVSDILTNSSWHPRGIKVRLIGGAIGRVQEIIRKSVPKDVKVSNLAQPLSTIRSNPNSQIQIQIQSQSQSQSQSQIQSQSQSQSRVQIQSQILSQRGFPQAIVATASKSPPGEVSSGNPNIRKGNENAIKGSNRTSPFANLQQFKAQLPGAILNDAEAEEIVLDPSGKSLDGVVIQSNEEAEMKSKFENSGKSINVGLQPRQRPVDGPVVENDESGNFQLQENGQNKGLLYERATQKARGRKEMEERKKKLKKEMADRRKEDGPGAEPSGRRVRDGTGLGLSGLADLKSALSFSGAPQGSGIILNDVSVNNVDTPAIEIGNTSSDIDDPVLSKSVSSDELIEASLEENGKELGNLGPEAEIGKKQASGESSKVKKLEQLAQNTSENTVDSVDGRKELKREGRRIQKDSAVPSNSSRGNEKKKTTSSESRAGSGRNRGTTDGDGNNGRSRRSANNDDKSVMVSKVVEVIDSGWRARGDTVSEPKETGKSDSRANNEEMQKSRANLSGQRKSVSRLNNQTDFGDRRGEMNKKELKVDGKEGDEVTNKVETSGGAPLKPQVTGEMILVAMQKVAIERAKVEAEKKAKASQKGQKKALGKEVEVIEGPVKAITVLPEWAEEIANLKLRLKELKSMSV